MDTPVIDFHCHVWSTHGIDNVISKYLRIMDAAGVDRSCINCINPDAGSGNDTVAEFVARHPDRFVGVAFVTPRYIREAVSELERSFDHLGMKFLKIYPGIGRPMDDPAYYPIFEWVNERGIAVMSHTQYFSEDESTLSAPRRFVGLAKRFPNVRWVLAHSGNPPQGQAGPGDRGRSIEPQRLPGDLLVLRG